MPIQAENKMFVGIYYMTYSVSQKSYLKLFAVFSLRLSIGYFRKILPFRCQCISTQVYQFWSIYLHI